MSDDKKQQVLALGRLGWPLRRIEEATGIRRETASNYLKAAGIPVRAPGAWGRRPPKPANEVSTDPARELGSKPANEVSTDLGPPPPPSRSPIASACEPYRELIEQGLRHGRNAVAIWQDLVSQHGFPARYASVRRFVHTLRGAAPEQAHPIIATVPGEEAQVDYGEGPMVRDPETGKYRRTRLFVLTLGFSRKSVRLLVWKSSTRTWAELHEIAFRRLGGAVRVVVLDNLREGVVKPDVYDPELNPLYCDVLRHYGAVALPCRVGHPDRKGKVESGVGHAQRTPLKGQRFESIELAQNYLDDWETRWADTRIHGTTKQQVAAMFAEEKPALLPLPLEPFRFYEFGERTVHLDGCVEVASAYYGVPPGWVGKQVDVQWDAIHVRILHPVTGLLLRELLRQRPGRHRIAEQDKPARTPPTTLQLLQRAHHVGKDVGALAADIHGREGEPGVRRILGLISLAKKHGAGRLNDACAVALEIQAPTYRFVRRYLERAPKAPLSLKQVDPLIRELTHYRDLVDRMTQENSDEPR